MRRIAIFCLLNIFGLGGAIYFASMGWAPSGEEGLPGGPGDGVIRIVYLFPIILFAAIVNLVWVVLWLRKIIRKGWVVQGRELLVVSIIMIGWIMAVWYDYSRQYRGDFSGTSHSASIFPMRTSFSVHSVLIQA